MPTSQFLQTETILLPTKHSSGGMFSSTVPGKPRWVSQQDGGRVVRISVFGWGCIPASLAAGSATLGVRKITLKADCLQW